MASLQNITRLFGFSQPNRRKKPFYILWRQRFQAARFPPMEKLHLAGRQKSVHVVQNQFCHLLIHMPMDQIGWLQLPPAGQDMLHAVSTEKRSIEPQQSKCTEKETRCCSGALNSGENAYFVSRTFCSHLLNWCSFSANKSSPVQGKCLPVKQHPDAMVIMVLVGWEDEDKAWRINGKVMTLSWGWMQLLPRLNKRERFNASQCRHRLKKATAT